MHFQLLYSITNDDVTTCWCMNNFIQCSIKLSRRMTQNVNWMPVEIISDTLLMIELHCTILNDEYFQMILENVDVNLEVYEQTSVEYSSRTLGASDNFYSF